MTARLFRSLQAHTLGLCALLMVGALQAEELPRSPACRTALGALNDAEDALVAAASRPAAEAERERQRAVAARLQPLRKRVADACLGGLTTSPPPSQHTPVVPTSPASPPATAARPLTPMSPPAGVTLPRPEVPVTVNSCNAVTCVASDGSTLTRVGPGLVGPRGACTVQGMFVKCP